jgi:hypothetical protein
MDYCKNYMLHFPHTLRITFLVLLLTHTYSTSHAEAVHIPTKSPATTKKALHKISLYQAIETGDKNTFNTSKRQHSR